MWQVTLYKEGVYQCGGTLIYPHWFLTHVKCTLSNPELEFRIDKLGASDPHSRFQAPTEQFRRVD